MMFTHDENHWQDQSWIHQPHQDVYLQHLQNQAWMQETVHFDQMAVQSTQNMIHNQTLAQQLGQPHHHHHGLGLGSLAVGGMMGYLLAQQRYQQMQYRQQMQPRIVRPEGWRKSYLWVFIVAAFAWQMLLVMALGAEQVWVIGWFLWIPAWILGIAHQIQVSRHNARLG